LFFSVHYSKERNTGNLATVVKIANVGTLITLVMIVTTVPLGILDP